MKTMTSLFTLVLILLQTPTEARAVPLDQLYPGYQPTVFNSYSEIERIFNNMPQGFRMPSWKNFRRGSECYQRAQIWTYDFARNQQIFAMKVFVFYTATFRAAYHRIHNKKFDWWFHVSPYLLMRDQNGNVVEYVVDRTYAEKPLSMKPWTDIFVETKRKCAEFVPFEKFAPEVQDGVMGTEHCYIVRVPATDYDPVDVEARSLGTKTDFHWNRGNVEESVDNAPVINMRQYYRDLLGL